MTDQKIADAGTTGGLATSAAKPDQKNAIGNAPSGFPAENDSGVQIISQRSQQIGGVTVNFTFGRIGKQTR